MKNAFAYIAWFFCLTAICRAQAQTDPAHWGSSTSTPPAKTDDSMVLIHGATFAMGIDTSEIPRFQKIFNIDHPQLFNDELPKHTVTVADFYLDKHLVTNAQFKTFLQAKPDWRPKQFPSNLDNGDYAQHWADPDLPSAEPDHPAVNVHWYVAAAFCGWAGKRLPTEAEWEFAARGGKDNALFPWGDGPPDQTRANFAENIGTTTAVEAYPPNAFGLYDMAGNVWQFLADDWTKYPDHTVTGTPQYVHQEALEVAAIHPNAVRKVIRGGSYAGAPINLWVEYRDSHAPNNARGYVGFRCAKSVSPKTAPQ
jgi:sulfatase modifying factor 1